VKGSLTTWAVVLATPTIWFASFLAGFAIAPLTCARQSNALLWLISGIALALDAVCGYVAWREWQRGRDWLALNGIILSGGFFLVIGTQGIPILMLAGCQ
jgi:heme/copper-type cytochrome/quinol oxidase subunit 3